MQILRGREVDPQGAGRVVAGDKPAASPAPAATSEAGKPGALPCGPEDAGRTRRGGAGSGGSGARPESGGGLGRFAIPVRAWAPGWGRGGAFGASSSRVGTGRRRALKGRRDAQEGRGLHLPRGRRPGRRDPGPPPASAHLASPPRAPALFPWGRRNRRRRPPGSARPEAHARPREAVGFGRSRPPTPQTLPGTRAPAPSPHSLSEGRGRPAAVRSLQLQRQELEGGRGEQRQGRWLMPVKVGVGALPQVREQLPH